MANKKITDFTALTAPVSTDIIELVDVSDTTDSPFGSSKQVTLANAITKAHSLSDGIIKVASGVMSGATANTDYYAPKAKLDATTAPGSANDNTQGYAVGSVWVDITGDKSYIAVDVSTGAAVWNDLTASAGGGISNVVEDLTPQLGGDLDLNSKNITTGATTISPTEISYLDGLSSAIQGQLDGKQASDAQLTDIAGLTPTDNGVVIGNGTNFVVESGATLKTSLGLTIGTDVQAQGATLTALEALTLAQGDLLYATGADTPANLAKGTASQQLRMNAGATAPEWFTATGGGQTTYDAIVATSGGTHTTLGAAITAASNNWRILVLDSTTESASITSSLTGLTIEGAGVGTTIGLGTLRALTLSGINLTMQNLTLLSTGDAAVITLSGDNAVLRGVKIDMGSTVPTGSGKLVMSGLNARLLDSELITTSTSTSVNGNIINFTGASAQMVGCHVMAPFSASTTSTATINFDGIGANCTGNLIENTSATAASTDSPVIRIGGGATNVTGNLILCVYNCLVAFRPISLASTLNTVSGNFIRAGALGIHVGGTNCSVLANHIYLYESASSLGINVTSSSATVSSNVVYTSDGTKAGAGIYIGSGSDDSLVSGNRVSGFQYGVQVSASTCDNNDITANKLYNNTTAILDSGTGTNMFENHGADVNLEKKMVYMKNTSGGAFAVGGVVVLKAVANGDEVTTTTTAGDDKVFGIATTALADATYGYIQTLGRTTALKVDGTTDIAIGDFLTTFTTAGIAAKAVAGDMVFAIACEAYTTNDSSGVIDALLISPRLI